MFSSRWDSWTHTIQILAKSATLITLHHREFRKYVCIFLLPYKTVKFLFPFCISAFWQILNKFQIYFNTFLSSKVTFSESFSSELLWSTNWFTHISHPSHLTIGLNMAFSLYDEISLKKKKKVSDIIQVCCVFLVGCFLVVVWFFFPWINHIAMGCIKCIVRHP